MPAARPGRTSWLHPNRQATNEPTHFEPAAEFLEELIEEDRRRVRRRRIGWFVGVMLVLAIIAGALWIGYQWTQTRYYVGADEDTVVIFQGVQQGIGPLSLSTPYEDTQIPLDSLSEFARATVEQTISASSLSDARRIVQTISETAGGGG
nr:hypothetical protein GCM10025699_08650 [Microbacterium flavescens]